MQIRQRRNHADDFNRTSEHQHQELTSTKSLVQVNHCTVCHCLLCDTNTHLIYLCL